MTKYDDGDDGRDNDRNEDRNENDNSISGSGSNGLIFDPITMHCSCLGLEEEDWVTKTTALRPWHTIYICIVI